MSMDKINSLKILRTLHGVLIPEPIGVNITDFPGKSERAGEIRIIL